MNRLEDEDPGDDLVDDLLQDFRRLSRRTVSLSRSLRSLLGRQQRIGCEMKQITNSLKVARFRTEDLAKLFERSAKRVVFREKRKENEKEDTALPGEVCRSEDNELELNNSNTSSCDETEEDIASAVPYRTRILSMGGNCSSKEEGAPRKVSEMNEDDQTLPDKYLSGSISSSSISIPNAIPHETPPEPPTPKSKANHKEPHVQSQSNESKDFPKEVLVVSDGTNTKLYRLCEVDESNLLSNNKEKLSSSCKVLQIHVDDPGSPLLRRAGNNSCRDIIDTVSQTFDERGNVLHRKSKSEPHVEKKNGEITDEGKIFEARPLSLDLGPLCEDVGEKFLFLLEEEEEAYERLKEELKEELKIPELNDRVLKETS